MPRQRSLFRRPNRKPVEHAPAPKLPPRRTPRPRLGNSRRNHDQPLLFRPKQIELATLRYTRNRPGDGTRSRLDRRIMKERYAQLQLMDDPPPAKHRKYGMPVAGLDTALPEPLNKPRPPEQRPLVSLDHLKAESLTELWKE